MLANGGQMKGRPSPKNLANWFPGPLKIQILFAVLFRAARINRCCFVQEQSAGSAGFFRKFSKFAIGRQLSWRANYAGQTRQSGRGFQGAGSPLRGKLNFFRHASPYSVDSSVSTRVCQPWQTHLANWQSLSGRRATHSGSWQTHLRLADQLPPCFFHHAFQSSARGPRF